MSDHVTLKEYEEYLSAMRELTYFTEKEIFPGVAEVYPEVFSRVKLAWINEDLTVLGAPPLTNYNAYTNISLPTLAERIGWLYVVEGSTLGGRMILKFLNGRLPQLQQNGTRFLEGYGAETGSMWKGFLQFLSAYSIENNKEEEVIAGATKAFEAIYLNFNA